MRSFGFPKMQFEENEKRDFMPDFIHDLSKFADVGIFLEKGYGRKLGFEENDYLRLNPNIRFVDREDTFRCDLVCIIRTPVNQELALMKQGSSIFSMLHFITHEKRCELLHGKGVKMYAMDSVVDDQNRRIIEDFRGTAVNGITAAVIRLLEKAPAIDKIRYLVLGSGLLGKYTVDVALHHTKIPAICTVAGSQATSDIALMESLIRHCDILVDTTLRKDTSKFIISNNMLELLPQHAVILDLTADDYDTRINPAQVKAIEGIPTGNLDQYIFEPDDKSYSHIPPGVNSTFRRTTVSCYSWPAINPEACLNIYQKQLLPFMKLFSAKNNFNIESDDLFERALARSKYVKAREN